MTSLQKWYGEYSKIEKPVLITTSYEGSNDQDELKTVSMISSNNNYNVVTNFDNLFNVKNDSINFFDEDIEYKDKMALKTTTNTRLVQAMKKQEASCHAAKYLVSISPKTILWLLTL